MLCPCNAVFSLAQEGDRVHGLFPQQAPRVPESGLDTSLAFSGNVGVGTSAALQRQRQAMTGDHLSIPCPIGC